ncbi:hypothetical protein DAEQUDRAFT_56012 [Daedalea quercina L-15889]|uniref:Uncharacterized protein n=1 Tax=Daedalea quercina L-15889 TaxID=1314783 RepID=A0A165SJI3_9APHY|nr:hypothetical protein DAEQUDRAFT_56012 [Daedalea quercina L-15889]
MVLTLFGNQKVPGTPARSQTLSTEQSPGTNFLAGFSFSHIGQQPSLLKRLSSADHEQELQYPSSPSTPPLPEEHTVSAASREPTPSSFRGVSLTTAPRNATRLREVSFARASPGPIVGLSSAPPLPAHPTISSMMDPSEPSSQYPEFAQPDRVHGMDSSLAPARGAPILRPADRNTPSPRASPSASAGMNPSTPFREACRVLVAQEATPADLVARISHVALEKAEWGEMKALMERYRGEHKELIQRNEESARAYQREREQASKVSAIVDTAFTKFVGLFLRQEERLVEEQRQAESALADAQRVIADRQAREAAETAEAARTAVTARERLTHAEMEERRKTAEEEAQRIAEEEARTTEAQMQQAEEERREAAERRRVEEERKAAAAAAAEEERRRIAAAEAVVEEERRKHYKAKRAEAEERKRAHIEAQRLEAIRQQEKRPKTAKEDLKARLEKEKREVTSRSASVSSASVGPQVDIEPGKDTSDGSESMSKTATRVTVQSLSTPSGSPSATLSVNSALPPKPVASKASRSTGLQLTKNKAKENSTAVAAPNVSQPAQLRGSVPSPNALHGTHGQETTHALQPNVQSGSELHTPTRIVQANAKPETVTPRLPAGTPAPGAMDAVTSEQLADRQGLSLNASGLPARPARASETAQRAAQRNQSLTRVAPSSQAEQPVVKREESSDLVIGSLDGSADPRCAGVIQQGTTQEQPSVGFQAENTNQVDRAVRSSMPNDARANHYPGPPTSPAQNDASTSRLLAARLQPTGTSEMRPESFDAASEMNAWVSTTSVEEDEPLHRRLGTHDEGSYNRSAYVHYSPPRAVTPPRPQRVVSREWVHYSPTPRHPPVARRERSPAPRKRQRADDNTWVNDGEPPHHRARVSPDETSQRRRLTAVEPPVRSTMGRWSPSWTTDSYNNDYAGQSLPYESTYAQNSYGDAPAYNERYLQPSESARQVEYSHFLTALTNESLPQASSWPTEQSLPLQQRIATTEYTLLERISDSQQGMRNAQASFRNARRADQLPTRSRGAAPRGRGRGRGNPTRGGGRQQHRLQSRLTGGEEGLGARLSSM